MHEALGPTGQVQEELSTEGPMAEVRDRRQSLKESVTAVKEFKAADFRTRLDRAIEASAKNLIGLQSDEGFWWGELEANCSIHAEYLLLTHFMDASDPIRWKKVVNYLKERQQPDGGWPIWYGGPSDLSIAVEAYFAMKLAGVSPQDPAMAKARAFILASGGVVKTRVFTKMWLALFGQWDWKGTPVVPAEIILLPNWFPFNIYEFASWARGTIVACMILLNRRPVCSIPEGAHIDELYVGGRESAEYRYGKPGGTLTWNGFFRTVDRILQIVEKAPVKPLRKRALLKAAEWIVERQEADGSWGGIQPPWVYSLMALKTMGYENDHPVIKKGLDGIEGFGRETENCFRTDPCISPVWDTCLAMLALQDAGVSTDHPALEKAAKWLLKEQIVDQGGDWQVKRPNLKPGGWAFEFANGNYPDTDDSAMVLIALHKMGWNDSEAMRKAMVGGVEWVEGMQSKNGGWGSFDVDNTKRFVTKIPFFDFGEVLDPPTEDVSAHVLELLGRLGHGTERGSVRRGLEYLKRTQEPDGSWWGRWGVNYIYGLGAVLPALKWTGEDMSQPYIRKAVRWLEQYQQEDGGWGEGVESYVDPSLRGQGPSTASQTAWGLLALVAAGEAGSDAARRGVEYLMRSQNDRGTWDEPQFTGTGFPGDFMINYHYYREYWPLMALGQCRSALFQEGANGAGHQ